MFFILNKSKIFSYLVAICTVVILFGIAVTMSNDNETIETSLNERFLPIYNVDTQQKKVAFTINCAWSADDIEQILEVLEKHQVKITFFCVGDWVDKNKEKVLSIYNAGHEIGNHSDTHPHVNNLTCEQNVEQINKCCEKIEAITGQKTKLYRSPYGEYNNNVIQSAKEANHIVIQWNLDTLDYTGITGEEMWKRLDGKLKNGSIILAHNGTLNTASSLEMLLNNIKVQGYEIVTISDLIYKDNYTIDNNGVQRISE